MYAGCGSSVGCFGDSDGCVESRGCDLLVTYALRQDGRYRLQLYGRHQAPGYLAMGLSTDTLMVSGLTSDGRRGNLSVGLRSLGGRQPRMRWLNYWGVKVGKCC